MFHLLFLLMQIRHGCILVSAVTVTSSFDALSFPSVASHHPCSSSSTFIYQLTLSSTSSHALDVWRRWVAFWKAESELLRFVVLPWSNIDLLSIDPVKNGVTFCFLLSAQLGQQTPPLQLESRIHQQRIWQQLTWHLTTIQIVSWSSIDWYDTIKINTVITVKNII